MSEETAAVEEAPQVEQLPDAQPEPSQDSFLDALDNAFAGLDAGADSIESVDGDSGDPEPEAAPEPEAEQASEPEPEPESEKEEPEAEEVDTTFDPTNDLDESLEDGWTPKAANRFKQLKSELKETASELEKIRLLNEQNEQKIKELAGSTESSDLEALQEKLKSYEQADMLNNLEQTEAFQNAVTRPLTALLEQSSQIAAKYDLDENEIIDLISLDDQDAQDEKMSELLESASDRDKATLYQIMNSINPILEHRQKLFENAEQAMQEAQYLDEQVANQKAAEQMELRKNATRNVVERVKQKLPFLAGIEGLDLAAVEQKAAENDPSVVHPVDFAYNSVSAQILPSVVREYVVMRKEVEELTDRLAEYEGAEPKMSGASPAASTSPVSSDDSFMDRVNKELAGMG
tara:strand:- start:825 stop:2039 length:1215 start_codon:yes stop_codon:yes gene_type:complete